MANEPVYTFSHSSSPIAPGFVQRVLCVVFAAEPFAQLIPVLGGGETTQRTLYVRRGEARVSILLMDIPAKIKEKIQEIVTTAVVSLVSLLLLGIYSLIDERYTNTAAKKALWALLLLLLIVITLLSSYIFYLRKQLSSSSKRNAGTIEGGLYHLETGTRIQGAMVVAQNEQTKTEYQAASDREGRVRLHAPAGDYRVTIIHDDYITTTEFCEIRDGFGHIDGHLQKKQT